MSSIQEDILIDFFKQLAELPEFDAERVQSLRAIFEADKKPKAASLVDAISSDPQDEVP
ncbi:MAG: hypothetical protein J5J06_13745 [Phycisphaerae bacterium]|nr:hypothetical protein [Phycisphaerae bacterium]